MKKLFVLCCLLVGVAQAVEPPTWERCKDGEPRGKILIRMTASLVDNRMPQIINEGDKPASTVYGIVELHPDVSSWSLKRVWVNQGALKWSGTGEAEGPMAPSRWRLHLPSEWRGVKGSIQVRAQFEEKGGKVIFLRAKTTLETVH